MLHLTKRFIVSLYLVVFLPISLGKLQATNIHLDKRQLSSLNFTKDTPSSSLSFAKDQNGNSWIKGYFSPNELGTPISLRIMSPLLQDYDLYIVKDSKYVKQTLPVYKRGIIQNNLFPHYNFCTLHDEFYIHIKQKVEKKIPIEIYQRQDLLEQLQQENAISYIALYSAIACLLFSLVSYFTIMKTLPLKKTLILYYTSILLLLLYNYGFISYIIQSKWLVKNFLLLAIPLSTWIGVLLIYKIGESTYLSRSNFIKNSFLLILAISFAIVYFFYPLKVFLLCISILTLLSLLVALTLSFLSNYYSTKFKLLFLFTVFSMLLTYFLLIQMAMNYSLNYNEYLPLWNYMVVIVLIASYGLSILKSKQLSYNQKILQDSLRDIPDLNSDVLNKWQEEDFLKKCVAYAKNQHNLTNREADTLFYIWQENSIKQISEKMFVSPSTIKFHTTRVYSKIKVRNRTQALELRDHYLKTIS
ncbi:response regulator transcription factor [Myroides sp. LJL116]